MPANKAIVEDLIDRFNTVLLDLPNVSGLSHVRHVELRPTLQNDNDVYQEWWANELPPTEKGFGRREQLRRSARAVNSVEAAAIEPPTVGH